MEAPPLCTSVLACWTNKAFLFNRKIKNKINGWDKSE